MSTPMAGTVRELVSELVGEVLHDVAVKEPPVDAVKVARGMGIGVRLNRIQQERGRIVESNGMVTIIVRPEPRRERCQWTIAHEIGEYLIPRFIDRWPEEMAPVDATSREWLANRFAMQLLVPTKWYEVDVRRLDGDLASLKLLYRTASYEVLAMRLLDVRPGSLLTIFDNGRLTRRMSNFPHRPPALTPTERDCWTRCRQSGEFTQRANDRSTVRAWAIHEDGWKREILLTAIADCA